VAQVTAPEGDSRKGAVVAAGGWTEFDEFYRSEFARFVVLAAAVSGVPAVAEDVAQEAMLDAHRRWNRVGGYESPRGWVRRVVVQRAMKAGRRRRNEHEAHLRVVTPDGSEPELADPELVPALRALPERQRAAVALHYLEDASVDETAELLGITAGSVKTHLSRARAALHSALDEQHTEEDR